MSIRRTAPPILQLPSGENITIDRPVTIGRSPDNEVVLRDATVSRHHCTVFQEGDAVLIRDQGSTSGTRVNGDSVGSSPRPLKDGDRITVGKAEFQVVAPPVADATATMLGTVNMATPADTQVLTRSESGVPTAGTPAHDTPAPRSTTLYVRRGPDAPRVIDWVPTLPFSIGRAPGNSLVVPDDSISRHHAELREHDGRPVLVDAGSANGVVLNGRRVMRLADLESGDVIVAGPLELVYDPTREVDAVLVQQGGRQDGAQHPVRDNMLLGSARECDIPLADPAIPPRLATLQLLGSDFWLAPLGDVPVMLNNREISRPTLLKSGDVIGAGSVRLTFRDQDTLPAQRQARTAAIQSLRQVLPFSELDEAAFTSLVQAGEEVTYEARAEILAPASKKQKSNDAFMCVLLSGEAEVIGAVAGDWGNTSVVARLSAGDYCGERALSHSQPYPHRVEAASSVRVFRLRRKAYEKLTKERPPIAGFFKDKVARHGLVKYLRDIPLLAHVPEISLDQLANKIKLKSFPAGDVLVRTSELSRTLFVVASGSFRVESPRGGFLSTLTHLSEGKYVGEQIGGADEVSPYTVVADTAGDAYTLTRDDYLALIEEHPPGTGSGAGGLPPSVVLARTPPFDTLAPELIADAAHALRVKQFREGETIIYQDDPVGSAFYIIARGQVDVLFRTKEGQDRVVNHLTAGQCFGEGALVTNSPRNATVKATEDCELLTLYRREFNEILSKSPMVLGPYLGHTFNSRFRPKHIADVEIFEQHDPSGITYIIKNNVRNTYISLSEQGLFIWHLLDGEHTMNDIAAAYFQQYKSLAMGVMFSTVQQLQQLGFLDVSMEDLMRMMRAQFRPTTFQRILMASSKIVRVQKEFTNADALFRALYNYFAKPFFSKPALFIIAVINVAGIVQFGRMLVSGNQLSDIKLSSWTIPILLLVQFVIVTTHEAGHGVTMIHIGRKVLGAGFGLMYLNPFAFVNTTDAWLATKGQRIAVTAGGILVTTTLAAIATLLLLVVHNPFLRLGLAVGSLVGYSGLMLNIAPMLPTDGYNLLMDTLQIPDLRPRALHFMFSGKIFKALRHRPLGREQRAFAIFGVLVIVFMIVLALQSGFMVVRMIGPVLRAHLPLVAAVAIQILMVSMTIFTFSMSMVKEAGIGAQRAA